MRLVLPYPPSANRYWRVWRGRAVKSDEARAYQMAARVAALKQRGEQGEWKPELGPVAVTLKVYRPRKSGDLDNSLKVLLDAIKGVAFNDDKQVKRIAAEQFDDKANPRVEVDVQPADALVAIGVGSITKTPVDHDPRDPNARNHNETGPKRADHVIRRPQ